MTDRITLTRPTTCTRISRRAPPWRPSSARTARQFARADRDAEPEAARHHGSIRRARIATGS
jgi:hypothetical protein